MDAGLHASDYTFNYCILPGSLEGAHQHSPGACKTSFHEQASEDALIRVDDESLPMEKLGTGILAGFFILSINKTIFLSSYS